jgi:hypothetical protein
MSKEKKIDYLEVDNQIPGQNYVCLSFLSPESLIQDRMGFNCAKFLQSYCREQNLKFDDIYNKYKDFTYKHEEKLQRDFDEQNDFQTSLRGLKVRGVYDTRQAAEDRAKKLSLTDSGFHTFVGQVGYWLPWDPNADKVADEVFQNSQLNDMMEKYQENNVNRDIFYEEQKREKIKASHEEVRLAKEKAKREEEEKKCLEDLEPEPEPEPESEAVDLEPEPESEAVDPEPEPEPEAVDLEPEPEKLEEVEESPIKSNNTVDEDLKQSLESDDPWMQKKMEEKNVN